MQEKINTAVELLNAIWVNVDFENMQKSRLRDFQSEFTSKIRGCATSSATIEIFIESVCKKLNILSFAKERETIHAITELSVEEKAEILTALREQLLRIINDLMIMRDLIAEKRKLKVTEVPAKTAKPKIQKSSVDIDIIVESEE